MPFLHVRWLYNWQMQCNQTHKNLNKLECTARANYSITFLQFVTLVPVWFRMLGITKVDGCRHDALDQWRLQRLLGIKWYQFVSNVEVQWTNGQPLLTSTIQARRLSLDTLHDWMTALMLRRSWCNPGQKIEKDCPVTLGSHGWRQS